MKEIKVGTFKIKSEWSSQLVKDLNNFHSIDASAELERMLTNQLKKDIRLKVRKDKIKRVF